MQLTEMMMQDRRLTADKGSEQVQFSTVLLLEALEILQISLDQFDFSGEQLLSGFFQSLCSLLQVVDECKVQQGEPAELPEVLSGELHLRQAPSELNQSQPAQQPCGHPVEPPPQEPVDPPKGVTELQKNIQILRTNLQSSWRNLRSSPGTYRAATGIYSAVAEIYRAAIGVNKAATEIYKAAAEIYSEDAGMPKASAGGAVSILLEVTDKPQAAGARKVAA